MCACFLSWFRGVSVTPARIEGPKDSGEALDPQDDSEREVCVHPSVVEVEPMEVPGSKRPSVTFADGVKQAMYFPVANPGKMKSTAKRVAKRSHRLSSSLAEGTRKNFSPMIAGGELNEKRAREAALAFRGRGRRNYSLHSLMQSRLDKTIRRHLKGRIKLPKKGKLKGLNSSEAALLKQTLCEGCYPSPLKDSKLARLYEAEVSLATDFLKHFEEYAEVVQVLGKLQSSQQEEEVQDLVGRLFSSSVFNCYWNENMLGWDMADWIDGAGPRELENRRMAVRIVVQSGCWDSQIEDCRRDLIALRQVITKIADRHSELAEGQGWSNEVASLLKESRIDYLSLIK